MSKEVTKGGRPAGIDQDFLHGIGRETYKYALIRGNHGLMMEHIKERKTEAHIERCAAIRKGHVKDVIDALIARGVLDPADLKPTVEDKMRYNDEEVLKKWSIPMSSGPKETKAVNPKENPVRDRSRRRG